MDDAIVVVENIHRHYKLQQHSRLQGAIMAVNEIGMPTILATLTVVLAFIPMAFVTGMMGPYMMPIPFNVPVAMIVSLVVAFVVTPWASYRLMKADHHDETAQPLEETKIYRLYKKVLAPLLENEKKRKIFLGIILAVFVDHHELSLVPVGEVPHAAQGEQEHLPRVHRYAGRHGDREHGPRRARGRRPYPTHSRGQRLRDLCGHRFGHGL